MTNDELLEAAQVLRDHVYASGKGMRHSYWDVIFDAEAHAETGEPTLLDRKDTEQLVQECLNEIRKKA